MDVITYPDMESEAYLDITASFLLCGGMCGSALLFVRWPLKVSFWVGGLNRSMLKQRTSQCQ